ncbi:hypothetical protein D0817_24655 [Flavobacterium cupreum]|uniref:Uncharacterized protein n=1 Tax=Flavobacterium cupreum TaxID=2133766 RepID=A0A434A0A1_9FLAO|nr:hypothetical protein [Flavobacterium cupreum]RUT67757.1 hypothetical protein D0817_24655 [Flavobacterium cupreum]
MDNKVLQFLIAGGLLPLAQFIKNKEIIPCSKDRPDNNKVTTEEKEFRLKIRFFKLTIKEGFFWNTQIWEIREKPLSDEQMENLFKK